MRWNSLRTPTNGLADTSGSPEHSVRAPNIHTLSKNVKRLLSSGCGQLTGALMTARGYQIDSFLHKVSFVENSTNNLQLYLGSERGEIPVSEMKIGVCVWRKETKETSKLNPEGNHILSGKVERQDAFQLPCSYSSLDLLFNLLMYSGVVIYSITSLIVFFIKHCSEV